MQSSACPGTGSTDPLLQIPNELSAVLTLNRGSHVRASSITSSPSPARNLVNVVKRGPMNKGNAAAGDDGTPASLLQTALSLKKKRESIVWKNLYK